MLVATDQSTTHEQIEDAHNLVKRLGVEVLGLIVLLGRKHRGQRSVRITPDQFDESAATDQQEPHRSSRTSDTDAEPADPSEPTLKQEQRPAVTRAP